MKKVLVLGAGLVSGPLVHYLLARDDLEVVVATRRPQKAEALVAGHPHGRAVALDAADGRRLWTHTVGARVDSPPTVQRGLARRPRLRP